MSDYNELHFFDIETFKEVTLCDGIGYFLSCNKVSTKRKKSECGLIQRLFNWLPLNLIKNNFELSTQCARTSVSSLIKKTYRPPFPVFNINPRYEPVAINTLSSDFPAIDDVSTCALLFAGTKTLVTEVYGM